MVQKDWANRQVQVWLLGGQTCQVITMIRMVIPHSWLVWVKVDWASKKMISRGSSKWHVRVYLKHSNHKWENFQILASSLWWILLCMIAHIPLDSLIIFSTDGKEILINSCKLEWKNLSYSSWFHEILLLLLLNLQPSCLGGSASPLRVMLSIFKIVPSNELCMIARSLLSSLVHSFHFQSDCNPKTL